MDSVASFSKKANPSFYSSGTVITSGSAVVPDYKPRAYQNVAIYNDIFKDNTNETKEFQKKIRNFYIDRMKKDATIDEETYRSQKKYGLAIFIIVVLLVLAGIGFSIVQLITAINYGNYSQLTTTFEIQKAGNLVLTTSLVGAFVLTVSLVFFFLFLQFVYKPNDKRKNFYENIQNVNNLLTN